VRKERGGERKRREREIKLKEKKLNKK